MKYLSTGLPLLDLRLGGGLPVGGITELFGPASTGKTALAMHIINEAMKQGLPCLYVNADCDFPDDWARRIGIDTSILSVASNLTTEELLQVIREEEYALVVVDTVTNLTLKDVESSVGAQLNSCIEQLASIAERSGTTILMLNQVRTPLRFKGKHHKTTGGRLLKAYCARRIQLESGGFVKDSYGLCRGRKINYKVLKAPGLQPYDKTSFFVSYCAGIEYEVDWITLAIQLGIIQRSGSWLSMDGNRLGQGAWNAVSTLRSLDWDSFCASVMESLDKTKRSSAAV